MTAPKILASCLLAALLAGCSSTPDDATQAQLDNFIHGREHEEQFRGTVTRDVFCRYLVYLPRDYREKEKWPLIIYLHSAQARGEDIDLIRLEGVPNLTETRPGFKFVVVSPQCPAGESWDVEMLNALLDHVLDEYDVDPSRVYLTGYDLGAIGAWDFAMAYPERFAAVAPVSGIGNISRVALMRSVPVWVVHGEKDEVVPAAEARKMIAALGRAGGIGKYSIFPDLGHDTWEKIYLDVELYLWFLEHTRADQEPVRSETKKRTGLF